MTSNTRSGGVGQGHASFSAPRSGRRALTDDGAEGTPATDARPCVFNKFTPSNRRVYAERPLNAGFSS